MRLSEVPEAKHLGDFLTHIELLALDLDQHCADDPAEEIGIA